ncbi:MAG: flagellar motor switch protein FliN [Candidatus Muiribacteriota bacterium]
MSDSLLSQDEIDALLEGASSNSANGEKKGGDGSGGDGPFSSDELAALKEFFELMANGAASVLLTLANNEAAKCEFESIDVKKLADSKDLIASPAHAQMEFNEGIEFKSHIFTQQDFLENIASMMLGGTEVDELTPEYISACEAFFDQIFGSVVMLWKNKYDIAARYVPPKLNLDNSPEGVGLKDELLLIKLNLALDEEKQHNLFIFCDIEEAKKILQKILKKSDSESAPVENKKAQSSDSGDLSQEEIDKLLKEGDTEEPVSEETAEDSAAEDDEYEEEEDEEDDEEYEEVPKKKKKKRRVAVSKDGKKLKKSRKYTDVDATPVDFADVEEEELVELPSNIDLLLDVPLQITVELGRTKMLVKDILELGTGSVIELERLAGESIDVLVNGKLIAKGEVVVIDENFGIRITTIVSPQERIAKLK